MTPRCDRIFALIIPIFLVSLVGCSGEDGPGGRDATGAAGFESPWLPQRGDAGEWAPSGKALCYEGTDLFVYINGGAEIYHEYGFRRVVVQDYENGAGQRINAEIFEMAEVSGAYGICSFKRGSGGEAIPVGNGGLLQDYYLNFWKGRLAVTLTGDGKQAGTPDGLRALAGAIDARLPAGGERPALVEALHVPGFVAGTDRFVMGGLGLFNSDPLFAKIPDGIGCAAIGTFDGDRRVALLAFVDPEKAADWAGPNAALCAKAVSFGTAGDMLSVCTIGDRSVGLAVRGLHVVALFPPGSEVLPSGRTGDFAEASRALANRIIERVAQLEGQR